MMKYDETKLYSRRKFIGIFSTISVLFLTQPKGIIALRPKTDKTVFSGSMLAGEFQFFTPYQATVIDEITSLIVPSDDNLGAHDINIVNKIDKKVGGSKRLKKLYISGIEWLDYMADKLYTKQSFLDLDEKQKIEILTIANPIKASYIRRVYLFLRYRRIRTAIKFFRVLKNQTFEEFYSTRTGWDLVDYQGPPQWSGFSDFHKCS